MPDDKIIKDFESKLEKADKTLDSIQKSLSEKASTTDVTNLQGTVSEIKGMVEAFKEIDVNGKKTPLTEYIKNVQSHADELEKKLDDKFLNLGGKHETQEDQLKKFFTSENYKKAIKTDKVEKGNLSMNFEVKANTITTSNSFTETASPIIRYERDPIVESDPKKALIFQQIIPKGNVNMSDYIDWVERVSETVGAAMKNENAQFGQSDLSWKSYARKVEKATDMVKVTREKLEDTDFVMSEIMDLLNYNIPYIIEDQILNGNGTSPNIEGMLYSGSDNEITTFDAPTRLEGNVDYPNMYSALKAAALQVSLGDTSKATKTGFITNYHVVNPVDYYLLSETKDNEGHYLFDPNGIMRVMGVPILQSQFVSDGEFVVGDFSRPRLFVRRNLTIRMWDQDSNDPEYDRVTFTASQRFTLRVKQFQKKALVNGTFANAISEIEKVSA